MQDRAARMRRPGYLDRSQFVRMPGGRQNNGKLQVVCYVDSDGICLSERTV